MPDIEERLEVFRHYIPTARQDQSKEFGHGLDLKNQAGGHELANKVIPFIQEVIAARNAG